MHLLLVFSRIHVLYIFRTRAFFVAFWRVFQGCEENGRVPVFSNCEFLMEGFSWQFCGFCFTGTVKRAAVFVSRPARNETTATIRPTGEITPPLSRRMKRNSGTRYWMDWKNTGSPPFFHAMRSDFHWKFMEIYSSNRGCFFEMPEREFSSRMICEASELSEDLMLYDSRHSLLASTIPNMREGKNQLSND